jgi:hypothetical protein
MHDKKKKPTHTESNSIKTTIIEGDRLYLDDMEVRKMDTFRVLLSHESWDFDSSGTILRDIFSV